MALYFVIMQGGTDDSAIVEGYNIGDASASHEDIEKTDMFRSQKVSLTPDRMLVRAELINPPLIDFVDQLKDGPFDTWDGADAVRTFVVRDKTPGEMGDQQQELDVQVLAGSGVDLSLVIVELLDWTIANTQLTIDDFPPLTQDAYHDIKARTERIQSYGSRVA